MFKPYCGEDIFLFFLPLLLPLESAVMSPLPPMLDEALVSDEEVEGAAIIAEGSEAGAVAPAAVSGVDIGEVGVFADEGAVELGAVVCATAVVARANAAAVIRIVFIVHLPN